MSRIGARQVVSVAENYSKYAWSFYHSVEEFTVLSDIAVPDGVFAHNRFIGHPAQQTTYAAGLATNVAILSSLNAQAALLGPGCKVNEAEYNKFRITRTDYILGSALEQLVQDNLDTLIDCP